MAFDLHANFGYSTVAVAPAPPNSGTSLDVASGQGALFPAAPFNVTVWPAGVNPLASNAEIVRVTAVVGDTLTIVRAQEGTTAINIAVGYQIANTTSRIVFTDIENAIAISAGTQNFQGPFTFADGGGITFGMNNGTVTGSVAPGGGGGAAISAGANSQSTGTVEFVASNGITFGLDGAGAMTASYTVPNTAGLISFVNFSAGTTSNNLNAITFANGNGITFGLNAGTMTASHDGLTSQSNQAASASNGSFTFQTLGFTNANGVTFGTSAGSLIFASVAAGGAPGSISAGTQTFALGQAILSNANGITFGMDNGTITASHNGLTSQSNQAFSASGGSSTFQTLSFANSNGLTFSNSNGSVIGSYTVPSVAGLISAINVSAGTTSNNLTAITFANSNGVTFGLDNGTITASVNTGGAAGITISSYENMPGGIRASSAQTWNGVSISHAIAFLMPQAISISFMRLPVLMTAVATTIATLASASFTASNIIANTYNAVAYSLGTGASSLSLQFVASGSGGFTFSQQISVTNSTQGSYTQGITALFGGGTTTLSTQYSISNTNYSFSTNQIATLFSSGRMLDIPFANSLSAGPYWAIVGYSSSSASGGPAGLAGMSACNVRYSAHYGGSQGTLAFGIMGSANMTSANMGCGSFSTVGGGTTSSLPLSAISTQASNAKIYFQLLRFA